MNLKRRSSGARLLGGSALPAFRRQLLAWYERHRRDLPWRDSRDPYHIWVSEVMLQQTRVAAVIGYYQRFLERFPSIEKLAAAELEQVLATWSGLGYYRRARAMHAAARQIVGEHGGQLPNNLEALRRLPGFGPYTSAAVASIAFGEPVAVVDGNVERVLRRLLGRKRAPRSDAWAIAAQVLSRRRPGDFNQAVMELGATVCVPGEPLCGRCPVRRWCATRGRGQGKRSEPRRQRQLHYRLVHRDNFVWLMQRPANASLMASMWELPEMPRNGADATPCLKLRHSITITDYSVTVTSGRLPEGLEGYWFTRAQLAALPLTGLTRKILRKINFI